MFLRKIVFPDAFKHVHWQNTFNRSKFHQILPLVVDYACFLVKCINYQKVICIQKFYFLQDLARFLWQSTDSCKNLARILQECHCIQQSCKKAIGSKNLARKPLHPRILQECHCIQESCKNAIASKNLARIPLHPRILQECHCIQESRKKAVASKNFARKPLHPRILQKLNFFARFLQEINFLSTRESTYSVGAKLSEQQWNPQKKGCQRRKTAPIIRCQPLIFYESVGFHKYFATSYRIISAFLPTSSLLSSRKSSTPAFVCKLFGSLGKVLKGFFNASDKNLSLAQNFKVSFHCRKRTFFVLELVKKDNRSPENKSVCLRSEGLFFTHLTLVGFGKVSSSQI